MKNAPLNNQVPSDDELKGPAPELSRLSNVNPFTVPDGYFESMHAEVMNKILSQPDFESASEVNPFEVPAGYFETLPTLIQQRIIDEKSKRITTREWMGAVFSRPAPKYALAFASVALLVLLSIKYFTRTIRVDMTAPQLSESEQLDAACLSQLDESVLAEVFTEEMSTVSVTQDQGIENYLLDNDIDLNSITEQL